MRQITEHIVDGDSVNHQLTIEVTDEPGAGGASYAYVVSWPGPVDDGPDYYCDIFFQDGPIKENGVNGITHEALLAIVIDRLKSFQSGPFACSDNEQAMAHAGAALRILQNRTRARIARGVEGTNAV